MTLPVVERLLEIRDFIWRQIFFFLMRFSPRFKLKKTEAGVVMLLQHRDVAMAIVCLQSLFYCLGFMVPVYVVSDGTLSKRDKQRMKKFFQADFINLKDAVAESAKVLIKFPHLKSYLERVKIMSKK